MTEAQSEASLVCLHLYSEDIQNPSLSYMLCKQGFHTLVVPIRTADQLSNTAAAAYRIPNKECAHLALLSPFI